MIRRYKPQRATDAPLRLEFPPRVLVASSSRAAVVMDRSTIGAAPLGNVRSMNSAAGLPLRAPIASAYASKGPATLLGM
jgi:hypothetical protein